MGFPAEVAPSLAQDRRAWPQVKWAHTAFGTRLSYPLLGPTPSEDLGQEPGCPASVSPSGKDLGVLPGAQTLASAVALRLDLRRVSAPAQGSFCRPFLTAPAKDTSRPERGTRRPGRAGQGQRLSDVTARSMRHGRSRRQGGHRGSMLARGPASLLRDSVSPSAEWGHSYPPARKPKGCLQCGRHGDLLTSAALASLATHSASLPHPRPGQPWSPPSTGARSSPPLLAAQV